MKKGFFKRLYPFLFIATTFVYSQNIIKGRVVDYETRAPLDRVNVVVKGNMVGTSTNERGEFTLVTSQRQGLLLVSHLGYDLRSVPFKFYKKEEYLSILLKETEDVISESVIVENQSYDIVRERKTPVAVTNIGRSEIAERLGNRDFPLVLRRTPSVYTTPVGGGYGDAAIKIRGFSQENIAVLVNGIPINDMENGRVYWSNWAGIADLAGVLQVQRGLGASKLAIPSVGGTINIVTPSMVAQQGGLVSSMIGNDGANKSLVSYNTGRLESGFSASVLFSRASGSRYVDGTDYEAYSYYLALGYQPTDEHKIRFMLTGAPQWHNERASYISIEKYLRYGTNGNPNRRYNLDSGYLNGREYNVRQNAYHKPIMSLSWDWMLSENSKISSTAYASFGRGYGTRAFGNANGKELAHFRNPQTEKYDFDRIVSANKASNPDAGTLILGGRVNSHDWYGFLTTFNHRITQQLSLTTGFDLRSYKGYHYVNVKDLLGASAYKDESNNNLLPLTNYISAINSRKISFNPFGDKIDNVENTLSYNDVGKVSWLGVCGQLEYDNDGFSAFVEGSLSKKGYQRIDNFLLEGTFLRGTTIQLPTETPLETKLGYTIKTGINKAFEGHNIFSNIGYYERQPDFNSVFRGGINYASEDYTNEKILGIEIGYGYKATKFNTKVNLYRTAWSDRFLRKSSIEDIDADETIYYAEISGLSEVHQGVEVEASYTPNEHLSFKGMFSYGDWFYEGNADALTYRASNNRPYYLVGEVSNRLSLLLDGAKVGGTAQMTANLSATIKPIRDIDIDIDWNYIDNLYADFDIYAFKNKEVAARGALKLPRYNLFDLGITYRLPLFKNHRMTFTLNVNNLLDTYYISEAQDNIHPTETSVLYKGVDVRNRVFFGLGRTWNFSMRYAF